MKETWELTEEERVHKFQQTALYLIHNMLYPITFWHLMYLLYQVDFDHIERYRSSVTGGNYRKTSFGPLWYTVWYEFGVPEYDIVANHAVTLKRLNEVAG